MSAQESTMNPAPAAESAPAVAQPVAVPTPTPTPATVSAGQGGVSLMMAGLIAMLASGLSVGAYHLAMAPHMTRLAVVDLPAVYREKETAFERMLTKEGATDKEREAALAIAREFAVRLPKALDELANECACTVLTDNAVAGRYKAVDLTATLRAKVGP